MAGIFETLFGSKPQDETADSQQQGTFFLDADSAKTLGDIEYMRTPRTIEHTFAKGARRVRKISSLKNEAIAETAPMPTFSFPETNGTDSAGTSRRNSDASLDSFRQMARGMKKG